MFPTDPVTLIPEVRLNSTQIFSHLFTESILHFRYKDRFVKVELTFWRRTFFQILAHPVFKM